MAYANRVIPTGVIVATPQRGTLLGNRGLLHSPGGAVRRAWNGTRWIVCALDFKGRKRVVMSPGLYTELFFLDEATAFAAGHRPCAECRRDRFNAFRRAWLAVHGVLPTAPQIDARLHAERIGSDQKQQRFVAKLADLPDGVFVRRDDWGGHEFLLWHDALLLWTPGGYTERREFLRAAEVEVLTPASTVSVIRAGYVPDVHPSA